MVDRQPGLQSLPAGVVRRRAAHVFKPKKGLNEAIVREMSAMKCEEPWMLKFRLGALQALRAASRWLPWFAERMPDLDFDDIYYYIKPTDHQVNSWEDLPDAIKSTYEKLGHPRGRAQVPGRGHGPVRVRGRLPPQPRRPRAASASSSATWTPRCASTPSIVRRYFGTIIPPNDNKFAALNSAVWSGGSLHLRARRG